MKRTTSNWPLKIFVSCALAAGIALPWMLTGFHTFQATQLLIYAIAILGLNLLTGFNGQISLGHGAFYAVGAYATAIMVGHGVPYSLAIPLAAAVSFAVGFLFGIPALRLEGHHLALATFALALAVPQLLKYPAFEPWTGGTQGIFVLKPGAPFSLPMNDDQWLYYLVLAISVLLFWGARNLLSGRVGRAITAIRDHHVAAEAMGINTALYKSLTFAVSAMYTGVAGALSAIVVQFVVPDSFDMFLSIYLFVGVIVGGLGTVSGAFIGGAFILLVPNLASDISKAATGSIYAIFLITLMYAMPDGIGGSIGLGYKRIKSLWLGTPAESKSASAPK